MSRGMKVVCFWGEERRIELEIRIEGGSSETSLMTERRVEER